MDPFKAALSSLEDLPNYFAGWGKGKLPLEAEGFLQRIQEATGLVPKLNPVIGSVLGEPKFSTDIKQLVGHLRSLDVNKNSPGIKHLNSFVHKMNELQVGAGYRVMGAGTAAPYIQMELGPGGEIINLPFETSRGRVTMGASTYAARQYSPQAGKVVSFSERMYGQISEAVPAGPEVRGVERARAIRGAIKATSKQLLENTRYSGQGRRLLGRESLARQQVRAKQLVIGPDHPLSVHYETAKRAIADVQVGGNAPDIAKRLEIARGSVKQLTEEVYRQGYSMESLKWEQLSKKLIVNLPGIQFYPGVMWGDLNKGIHQLLGKEHLDPTWVRSLGFKRGVPEIMSFGSKRSVEVGMNVGVLFGGTAGKVIGDSGSWVTDRKVLKLLAGFPGAKTKTVSVPGQYRHGTGTVELERRLSKGVESELRARGVFEQLEKTGEWITDKPIFISGAKGAKGGRAPVILGQNLGITARGEITEGKIRTIPKGYGIAGVKRIVTSGPGGNREYSYKFNLVEGGERVATGRGLVVGGTRRIGAMRYMKFGETGALRPGMLLRAEDLLKNQQLRQTTYASHWIGTARSRTRLGLDPNEVIRALGLRPGTFAGEQTAFGGDDWLVTAEKEESVKRLFRDALKNTKLTPAEQERWMRRNFYGRIHKLTGKDIDVIAAGYPEVQQAEVRKDLARYGSYRTFEKVPVALRNVPAGLKMRYGARLRLDHAMMNLLKMESGSSPANIGIEAFNKVLTQAFQDKLGPMTPEAANILGPLLKKGLHLPKGAQRISLSKYAKTYNAMPRIGGGVPGSRLIGTIADPKFSGAIVDLPFTIDWYHGSRKGLATSHLESASKTAELWLPSVSVDPIAPAEKGLFHSTKSLRLRAAIDEALRLNNPDKERINLLYNRYLLSLKSSLFGSKGRLNPKIRPKYSSYNALGLLSFNPEQALDIGMVEEGVRARYGEEAGPILERMAAGKPVNLLVVGEPAHSPSTMAVMRLRLMKLKEIASLNQKGSNAAKTVYVGQGGIFGMLRDQDLDRVATFLPGDKLDDVLQDKLTAVRERQLAVYQHIQELAERTTKDITPGATSFPTEAEAKVMIGELGERRVSGIVGMMSDKYEIPVANLFFRHRVSYASLAARAQGGDKEALSKLVRIGADELVARAKLSREEVSAMASLSGMVQQTFIGKTKVGASNLMDAIRDVKGEGPKDISRLEKMILSFYQETQKQGKYIPPGPISMETHARATASGYVKLERILKEAKITEPFLSGVFGRSGDTKLVDAMARTLGVELSEEQVAAMHDPKFLRSVIAEAEGVKPHQEMIAALNEQTKTLADYLPSSVRTALEQRGVGGAFGQLLSDVWSGKTWMGSKGGKAAIIGGGALLAKGLIDVFSGSDEIAQDDGTVQNPALTPLPANYQPPSFALMGESYARIENPASQPFAISGAMQADNSMDFNAVHNNIMISSGMRPGGYGYFEDRNIPVDENEMETYLRNKMRSSF